MPVMALQGLDAAYGAFASQPMPMLEANMIGSDKVWLNHTSEALCSPHL